MRLGCVLMAAGCGSRFGQDKLLYMLEGRPLLEHALGAVPASLFARAVAVVATEQAADIARRAGYVPVNNPDPGRGQGSSIALGAQAMQGLDGAMFCVADQPYLSVQSVQRLLDAFSPGTICAMAWQGHRGNPVLFPSECIDALAALSPGQTGRAVIAAFPGRILTVEASDPRELLDIDTKADLRRGQDTV